MSKNPGATASNALMVTKPATTKTTKTTFVELDKKTTGNAYATFAKATSDPNTIANRFSPNRLDSGEKDTS